MSREIQQEDSKHNLKKYFPTVRFTNRKFIVPFSYRNTLRDEIVAQETSTELPRHGAKARLKNHRDAYLTGLFAALRTLKRMMTRSAMSRMRRTTNRAHSIVSQEVIQWVRSLPGPKVVRLKRRILANYALEHLKVLQ